MLPLKDCKITSPYGVKRTINGKTSIHKGIDLISDSGDVEVKAIRGGVLRGNFQDPEGYGNYTSIEHTDGTRALYCHLKSFKRKVTNVNQIKQLQMNKMKDIMNENEIEQLEDRCNLPISHIVYDSQNEKKPFQQFIIGKKNLIIHIESEEGDRFGCFIKEEINQLGKQIEDMVWQYTF